MNSRSSAVELKRRLRLFFAALFAACIVSLGGYYSSASALSMTQNGSIGLQGTVSSPPPTTPANITTPGNGQVLTNGLVTVGGQCTNGLLVEVFSNNVFAGSTKCSGGTFSIQASLFNGTNQLDAKVYDALGQSGPNSNTPIVQYSSAKFSSLGPLLTLSSIYATQGINPGNLLSWPITISGGSEPYSLSINWGDGTPPQSQSAPFFGNVMLSHTYQNAGTYNISVKATDVNGEVAFLQMVGVANGAVPQSASTTNNSQPTSNTAYLEWWPAMVILPLLLVAFWLGGAHRITSLKKKLDNGNDNLK